MDEAFEASCSLNGIVASDWHLDIGASAHMSNDPSYLDQTTHYTGKDCVIVENGASLPITHTCKNSPPPDHHPLEFLVVSRLSKNILSISKLTHDFSLFVTFNNNSFTIQNRQTKTIVATGKRDGSLYVLGGTLHLFLSLKINLFMLCMIYGIIVLDM